jgi:hypothetical protein
VCQSTFDAFTGKTYFTFFDAVTVAEPVPEGVADGLALADALGDVAAGRLGTVADGTGAAASEVAEGSTNCGVAATGTSPVLLPQPARQTANTVKPERVRSNGTGPSWQKSAGPADPSWLGWHMTAGRVVPADAGGGL